MNIPRSSWLIRGDPAAPGNRSSSSPPLLGGSSPPSAPLLQHPLFPPQRSRWDTVSVRCPPNASSSCSRGSAFNHHVTAPRGGPAARTPRAPRVFEALKPHQGRISSLPQCWWRIRHTNLFPELAFPVPSRASRTGERGPSGVQRAMLSAWTTGACAQAIKGHDVQGAAEGWTGTLNMEQGFCLS